MRAAICALTVWILSSPACYTNRSVRIDEALTGRRVWVTLSDQSIVVVAGAKVNGATLVGLVDGKYAEFPPARVKKAHVRQLSRVRTAGAVAAGLVGLVVFAGIVRDHDRPPSYCDASEHMNEPVCQGPGGNPFLSRSRE